MRAPTQRLEGSETQSTKRPREFASFVMDRQRGKPSLHGSDATATKHTSTTATALQLHFASGSHWGWSRFSCGGFFQVVGQVSRSVAQSVEVTPKRSKERGGRSQRLQGQSPQNESETRETESQKVQSTWSAERGWTSEGFWQYVHKVQSTWPVQ